MALKVIRGFESHTLRSDFRGRAQNCSVPDSALFALTAESMRFSKRILLRMSLLLVALPCVYFGAASAAYYLHKRHAVLPILAKRPAAFAPNAKTRLLIFAPHCDDETLGCAGLIQQTLAAGGKVKIVFFTNGDGFRVAVQRNARTIQIEPRDYVEFAELRQSETYTALKHLGVGKADIVFLGYPDRGLMSLWQSYWTPDKPYTSQFTQRTASPYPETYNPKAVYCGQNVADDLRAVLNNFQPNWVTVTHPLDDHPDHAAASAFVTYACRILQHDSAPNAWARNLRLEYYLIHRGDWPLPMGDHPTLPMAPPAEMMATETRWNRLDMTQAQTRTKAETIDLYASQTAIMDRYLASFARTNEMLGGVPRQTLSFVPSNFGAINGDTAKWQNCAPICRNPVNDSMVRDLQAGGDIGAVYACRDTENLYLRFETRKEITPRMVFALQVRAFDREGNSTREAFHVVVSPSESSVLPQGVTAGVQGRTLEAAIPVAALTTQKNWKAIRMLAISGDTAISGLEVDKTGITLLDVPSEEAR